MKLSSHTFVALATNLVFLTSRVQALEGDTSFDLVKSLSWTENPNDKWGLAKHGRVRAVEWQKQKDSFSFTKDPTGRTLLTAKRDGQETVASAAEATTAMDTSGK